LTPDPGFRALARSPHLPGASVPDDPLSPQRAVSWDEITRDDVAAYKHALEKAQVEGDMQRVLEEHPRMLAQPSPGKQQAWILPQQRLGAEHVTDFLIAQQESGRYSWCAVELEGPQKKMFNKNGDPSHTLTHALRQIGDWRTWTMNNIGYASRPTGQLGLGLLDIDPFFEGLIIIGRASEVPPQTTDRRRSIGRSNRVRIETYDWLLSTAQERLEVIERARYGCRRRSWCRSFPQPA
jgi:hypothetical protein